MKKPVCTTGFVGEKGTPGKLNEVDFVNEKNVMHEINFMNEMDFVKHIHQYIPINEQETQDKKVILDCINRFPDTVLRRENEIAHITSSGFILNNTLDKCLMVHHNIRQTWAWTGGHADGNGHLLEVAVREANEETGVKVTPCAEEIASLDVLTVSGHVKKGRYVNSHLHLSVAFVFVADENEAPMVKPDENSAVAWMPMESITEDLFTGRDVYLYTKLYRRAKAWWQP